MKPLLSSSLTCLFLALLASCGVKKPQETKKEDEPFGPTGIPIGLRAKNPDGSIMMDGGTPVAPGGNTNAAGGITLPNMKGSFKATAEEDILYTDPDNPDAGIPELAAVLGNPNKGPWEESETKAKQRSMREGKPLLIWFTDSMRSPMCKAVQQELFSREEFSAWARENVVRLRVDTVVPEDKDSETIGDQVDRRVRITNYTQELRKRYKIMGYPSFIVLSPNGEVVGRYRGYQRGEADLLWGKFKHADEVASRSYSGWKSGLEKKGYRVWADKRDRRIFAKLVSYSKGTLVLIEPDGSRAQTKESSLSDSDRAWIAEQKKLRGLQ